MRTRIATGLVVFAVAGTVLGADSKPGEPGPLSLEKVKSCLSANIPADVRAQSVEFRSTDKSGSTRKLTGNIFASQEVFEATTVAGTPQRKQVRAVMQVDGPKDLAGSAYLVRESGNKDKDGIYFYLPSIGKSRKISGTSASSSLLGTDFSFYEFKVLLNSYDGMTMKLESLGELDGRKVFIITLKPDDAEAGAGLTRGWIDEQTCVPLKLDFYRGDKLSKEAFVKPDDVKLSRGVWYPVEVQMKDLGAGSNTVLHATIVERKVAVPPEVFEVDSFQKPVAP
jgi:hypothetical protein